MEVDTGSSGHKKSEYQDKEKPAQVRASNITAAKGANLYVISEAYHTEWSPTAVGFCSILHCE